MNVYEVRLSEPAESDIDSHYQFLFMRDPRLADTWRTLLTEVVASLSELPHRCSIAPESGRFQQVIRQLWFGSRNSSWRIVYTVIEDASTDTYLVKILRVRHHAQAPLGAEDAAG